MLPLLSTYMQSSSNPYIRNISYDPQLPFSRSKEIILHNTVESTSPSDLDCASMMPQLVPFHFLNQFRHARVLLLPVKAIILNNT